MLNSNDVLVQQIIQNFRFGLSGPLKLGNVLVMYNVFEFYKIIAN